MSICSWKMGKKKKRKNRRKKGEMPRKEDGRWKKWLDESRDFHSAGWFSYLLPPIMKSRLLERFSFYACNFYAPLMQRAWPVIRNRVFSPGKAGLLHRYSSHRQIQRKVIDTPQHRRYPLISSPVTRLEILEIARNWCYYGTAPYRQKAHDQPEPRIFYSVSLSVGSFPLSILCFDNPANR